MPILKFSHIFIPALMLLSACGGGSGGGCAPSDGRPLDTTTDTSANCAETRAANTIVIAYPSTDAISQLEGAGAAIYSHKGSAVVTDQNGNGVSDNTVVQLDVFDTLIARGTIATGDTISGSILTDNADIFKGDGTTETAINTAVVTRNSDVSVGIKAGDLVILVNAASSDRIRYVSSITANSITVDSPYNNSYPSTAYPGAKYLVGRALVGAKIYGIDALGKKSSGVSKTIEGNANFRLEYPGNKLNYGASSTDPRELPFGSTEVWVVAKVGGIVATADKTSFIGIAPGTITVSPAEIAQSQDVTITLLDAQNNALPFVSITTGSDSTSTATSCTTDQYGKCTSTVTKVAAGKITYSSGKASGTLDVK